jgi:hypothetical protein
VALYPPCATQPTEPPETPRILRRLRFQYARPIAPAARRERAAARSAHNASRFWTYLLAALAGLVVALALHNDLVPALWTSYWGGLAALFAMLVGILLMWLAEHTRPA